MAWHCTKRQHETIPTVAKDGQLDGIKSLKKIGTLEYVTPNGIHLHPFYDAHHERYVVYWQR